MLPADPEASDRRHHVVYVTRHTEYHCRDRECVGVRNRRSGQWQRWHGALRAYLVGCSDGTSQIEETPRVGRRLLFVGEENVLTSSVVHLYRPERDAIWSYASRCVSGAIDTPVTSRSNWRFYRWMMTPSVVV